jgi:hypothetical protein
MEYWMIGALGNRIMDTVGKKYMGNRVGAAFFTLKTTPSIPNHCSNTPLLQASLRGIPNKAKFFWRGFFTDSRQGMP